MSAAVIDTFSVASVPSHATLLSTATASGKPKVEDAFFADAVLFDMDGTLVDSVAAGEAAWGRLADDLGLDRKEVITYMHGKRGADTIAHFCPEIKAEEMVDVIAAFERSILKIADAYSVSRADTPIDSNSGDSTPELLSSGDSSAVSSGFSSRSDSMSAACRPSMGEIKVRRPSFGTQLSNRLAMTPFIGDEIAVEFAEDDKKGDRKAAIQDILDSQRIESDGVDRAIRILPGVRALIDSIPDGRYAVATSGAETIAHGALTRAGITPPPVTITANDKRIKKGKPAPDPFLIAAACLGFDARRCVVFEDSPSGIRAGVASGAIVIAVCTSHERSKIEHCGAHFIVDDCRDVKCEVVGSGLDLHLRFTVRHTPTSFYQ